MKKIIVGLGNPGDNFSLTKHNAGFWVIDKLVEQRSLKYKLGKGDYIYAVDENKYVFIKPTTFMNNSGIALKQILDCYQLNVSDIIVIYDDIDIHLGNIRYKQSGVDGGHNGIKSIIYHLNSDYFDRLKIGIGINENMRPAEKYVLTPFISDDELKAEAMVKQGADALENLLVRGLSHTMNHFNS